MVFTEGTIIMHKNAKGCSREEIVRQVEDEEGSVHDYASYVPVKNAVKKLKVWKDQGVEILYLTSRTEFEEIDDIRGVLKRYNFPKGKLFFREKGEDYKDVAERVIPDILIEDDCESIGGKDEMTITHIRSEFRKKIRSIPVKEFGGIDYLSDDISKLNFK